MYHQTLAWGLLWVGMSQGGLTGAEERRVRIAEDGKGTAQTPEMRGFGNAITPVRTGRNRKVWRQAYGSRQDATHKHLNIWSKRNGSLCLPVFCVIKL